MFFFFFLICNLIDSKDIDMLVVKNIRIRITKSHIKDIYKKESLEALT